MLPGYSPRAQQIEMFEAVEDALLYGDNLIVEAPTGTGKTLAYLVPALLSGHRIIISTGTKTLQDARRCTMMPIPYRPGYRKL